MSRTDWQQQLQLHNRVLVNFFLYQFWHGAQNLWLLTRLGGLCRQTLPFIHSRDFSLVERCQGWRSSRDQLASLNQIIHPAELGGEPDGLVFANWPVLWQEAEPCMLKKALPGATAPETFHVWHNWESLHILLLSVHLGVTSKQTEGTCLHQLWQELCGIKRNYLFSQPGLGLLLNIFFFKVKFFNSRWGHNFDQMPILHN